MTAPLTPADADLQDFPFMPLHVARLRDSDLAAEADPEACWYAVLLWSAAWHQLPAGSLPANEPVLARLCGLGRDLKTFKKHRADAMRGWIECDDGRLYHPVVAEQVNTAWAQKLAYRDRKAKRVANATKAAQARWNDADGTPDADANGMTDANAEAMRDASKTDASRMPDAMLKGTGTGRGTGSYKEEGSVADATAPSASKTDPPPDPTAAAETHLWDAGKRFLETRGVAKGRAGSMLGRWKGAHGTAAVIEALGVAQVEPDLVDPIPFIEGVLKRRANSATGGDGWAIGGVRMSSPC